ncbi:hypothetical protein DUI87_33563 [Hirundo rustica rustica]|uniref:Integrase catalytic domain-containing protein n=1 Tax=Hirundo rustica rustica TaxID=333673 RepID=A0A3M0INQ3_HIRRU|nr:hypothetical protein DUI87_33563 [Hirundo rustica rustica]
MDSISQVIHDCEMCAAIKQAKRVKPLWYGGRWAKYKYGEAWQIDYITLPQTRQGKRYVLTMVEATTGWLETYPVPHATAWNTILGLERQVLQRRGTPERIESNDRTHLKNSLVNTWAREHGIEWVYHIPYHAPAAGEVEGSNGLLKTTLKPWGDGTFKNWEINLAKATWLVNTRGSTNRADPAQLQLLRRRDGDKVPVVHMREQSANLHSSVTMIGTLTAAVCTAYGIGYSGYYLTHLARHLRRVFRGADPESTEARADSPLAPCALGEEAKEEQNDHQPPAVVTPQVELSKTVPLEKEHEQVASSEMPCQPCQTQGELFPAEEQEKQLRQQEEKPQENGQNIETEAQAEPSKAPSDIIVVKRRNKEDRKRIQDLWNRLKPRGDQQNQGSGKKLQAELLETQARIKALGQRVEEAMKLQGETQVEIHPLLEELEALQKQVDILKSRLATCNDFQQVTGNEEPQDSCEAQELSPSEVLPVEHDLKMVEEKRTPCEEVEHLNKELQIYTGSSIEPAAAAAAVSPKGAFAAQPKNWSPGSLFISSTAAAQQQEIEDDSLELLRQMASKQNPRRKYRELESLASGGFGDVCRAVDTATGGEVAIKKINLEDLSIRHLTVNEIMVMKRNRSPWIVNYLDREIPTAPGIIGYVNVPINTSDVRAFKKEMGKLIDDPLGVSERLDEFLGTSIYSYEDLTAILRSLFNTEEREMIRQAGIREWERRNPQSTPGDQKWPSQDPRWNAQTEEGRRSMIDMRNIIIQGIREAVPRGQNLSKVFGECQGKDETPTEWLERLRKSLQIYSGTDPDSPVGEVLLKTQFVAKSWEDIRKKLEKIKGWQEKGLQELLREAQKIYMRRDEEKQKIQARVLVAAVREAQKQERPQASEKPLRKAPPKGATRPQKGTSGNRMEGLECFYCKKKGHMKRDCPKRIRDEKMFRED